VFPSVVIPARAGIHPESDWKYPVKKLDSRFRGNDHRLEWNLFSNETHTRPGGPLYVGWPGGMLSHGPNLMVEIPDQDLMGCRLEISFSD
jgi:hypothetical protein